MYGRRQSFERFPFLAFRWIGWTLNILALIIIGLSIADLTYTVGKYTKDCNAALYFPRLPCNHKSFVFTYIASGIWGSLFALVPGYIATQFSHRQLSNRRHLQRLKDALVFTTSIVALMFAPTTIVLYSIEAAQGKDLFYYYEGDSLKTLDKTKLALPIVIVLLAFFEWCMAVILAYMCWIYSPISRYDMPSPDMSVSRGRGYPPRYTRGGRYPGSLDRKMHPWQYDNMHM